MVESVGAAEERGPREKTGVERQPGDPLSSCPGQTGEWGRAIWRQWGGQGQSLDIERFDSGVKGTAVKATGTSGWGWAWAGGG